MRRTALGMMLVAITTAATLTSCGNDGLDEEQFVEDLVAYSVPEYAARCVYERIADDDEVIADIRENGVEDDVSSRTADRLEDALTECLRGPEDEDSTPSTTEDS